MLFVCYSISNIKKFYPLYKNYSYKQVTMCIFYHRQIYLFTNKKYYTIILFTDHFTRKFEICIKKFTKKKILLTIHVSDICFLET